MRHCFISFGEGMTLVPQFGQRRSAEDVVFLAMREKAIPSAAFIQCRPFGIIALAMLNAWGNLRRSCGILHLRNAITPPAAMISQHSLVDPPSFGKSLCTKLLSVFLRFPF